MIKHSKKGLTLLGVIFSVGIALVGLVGIISLLRYVIILSRASSDRFIAVNIAQEGIEIVRAVRDSNWQEYMSVYNPATFYISVPTNYRVDALSSAPTLLSYSDTYLNKNSDDFYTYAAGTPTKFKRRIYLDPTMNGTNRCTDDAGENYDYGQCIRVVSEVKWGNYTLVIEDWLYNWKP